MKRSAVELFVKSYLRTHRGRSLPLKFVREAIILLETKLDSPCCSDSNATITHETIEINNFTTTLKQLLKITPRNGNVHSFQRTLTLLENRINGVCCGPVTSQPEPVEE